jgi:hypothetical protein
VCSSLCGLPACRAQRKLAARARVDRFILESATISQWVEFAKNTTIFCALGTLSLEVAVSLNPLVLVAFLPVFVVGGIFLATERHMSTMCVQMLARRVEEVHKSIMDTERAQEESGEQAPDE